MSKSAESTSAFGNREAGIGWEDDEGRNAACAGSLPGAGEDGVDISNAAVGNPGLLTVEHIGLAIETGSATHGGDVGACIGFRQGEGRQPLAAAHFRQHGIAQLGRCSEGNRPRAETLHGEGEIGQTVLPRQRFTRQTQLA